MLKSKIFLKAMWVVGSIIIAYALSISIFVVPKVDKTIQSLEEKNAKEVLSKVVAIANNVSNDLNNYRKLALQNHKNELRKLTQTTWSIIQAKYKQALKSKNQTRYKQEVIELVSKLRYGDNNYFYISDYNNILISHPYLQGKDFSNIKDKKGKLIVPPLVQIARKNGEGFYSYWWKKNKKDNTPYEKLTYAKDFPKWKMVIGTGVYIDDIEKEIKKRKQALMKQLRQIVLNTKIGKTGYLFIFDKNYNMLIHPNNNIDGKNVKNFKNPGKNSYIFDDLIASSKTDEKVLYYKWDKLDDKGHYIYDKVSWTQYVPSLGWYISSSAYVDDIESSSKEIKHFILLLSIVIFVMALVYSYIYLKNLLKPITKLSQMAVQVTSGQYSVKSDITSDDEIGILAKQFNTMVDTIEDNIKNLDTKVKQKTQELEKNEHYVKAILDSQINMVLTTDGHNMKSANKAFFDFFNVSSLEEFKSKFGECICDTFEKRDGYIQKNMGDISWMNYLLSNNTTLNKTILIKDNQEYIFSITAHEFAFDGMVLKTAVFTDITQDEKTSKELEIAKNKAEESTKFKSEFLANMSHEIRTPMNGIIGMSHLLSQTPLQEQQQNYLNKIDTSAKSLLGIINDILDFSKIEAGKLTIEKIDFDLFKTIEQVVNINEFKARDKGLELVVNYDINLGKEFFGDPLRLSQILTNLISNAIKFTSKGEIKIVIQDLGSNRARFEVIDQGIGLTKEQQNKLFKEFSQADGSTTRKYGGTGLGLAISKKLVQLMNGKIWVESEYQKGSNFIFEIELKKKENMDKPITIFENKTALVIDDTKSWQDILKYMLTNFGFDVVVVSSGDEAIQIAQNNSFDLIFIDWNMPNLNGIETTEILKQKYNISSEFILVSAYDQQNIINSAKDVGINYFIPKPINPSVLNDTISDILLGTNKLEGYLQQDDHSITLKQDITTLSGSKILLVEDNKTNQEIIVGLLEDSGIIIDIANDGEEAIQQYKKHPNYELIFMDLQMPQMDGYEATKIIREENKDIPIIALTANAMREDIEKTQKVGMNKHLNKPIEVEKLYETLLEYISKKTEAKQTVDTKNKDDIQLPTFETFDIQKALKLVMGNKKIVLNTIKGLLEYKNIKLEELDDSELQRIAHTIKGLSGAIGATTLQEISKEIELTLNKELFEQFYEIFYKIIQEIESKIQIEQKHIDSISIDEENKLFDELKEALASKKVKHIKPLLEQLDGVNLSKEKKELFEQIKKLTKRFKYKDAFELMES